MVAQLTSYINGLKVEAYNALRKAAQTPGQTAPESTDPSSQP
jgi:hypothetical protein